MHSVYVSSFWGLRSQTPTGAVPLHPVGGLLFCPPALSKFLATPLLLEQNFWCLVARTPQRHTSAIT